MKVGLACHLGNTPGLVCSYSWSVLARYHPDWLLDEGEFEHY